MSRQIELRPAYSWDCDECGHENFVRGGIPDLCKQDLQFLKAEEGIEPWEIGQFTMIPTKVTCKNCNLTLPSIPMGSEQDTV